MSILVRADRLNIVDIDIIYLPNLFKQTHCYYLRKSTVSRGVTELIDQDKELL